MTRRHDRYVTVDQASKALSLHVSQILGMLESGELPHSMTDSGDVQLVSVTDIELVRRRLEALRQLDGDQQ